MELKVVWAPIAYEISYRQYRHRLPNTTTVREDVPISIRHYDRSEVVHVATIAPAPKPPQPPGQHHYGQKEEPYVPQHPYDIYLVDGQLMRPMLRQDGREATFAQLMAESEVKTGWADAERKDYPFRKRGYPVDMRTREQADIYDFRSDTRELDVAAAHAAASAVAILDDVILVPAIEPIYELDLGMGYGAAHLRLLPAGLQSATDKSTLFRLDELEDAFDIATKLSGEREVKLSGSSDVFDAGSLMFDPLPHTIERLTKAVNGIGISGFGGKVDTAMVRAWCDAKDAWDGYLDGRVELESATTLLAAFEQAHRGKNPTFQQLERMLMGTPMLAEQDLEALAI